MRRTIFILMFVILMFFTQAAALDIQLWNAPLVPDAVVAWKDKPVQVTDIHARATLSRSKMSVKEILEFYESSLVKNGWKIKDVFGESGVTAFTRENNYFYVAVRDNGKGLYRDIYLISSPADLAICRMISANMAEDGTITRDVSGEDMKIVPRYPGSKRMMNMFSSEEGDTLMYQAKSTVNEIAKFYEDSLKPAGWRLTNMLDPDNVYVKKSLPAGLKVDKDAYKSMEFEKGRDILSVGVFSLDKAQGTCLILIVKYSERSLKNMIGG